MSDNQNGKNATGAAILVFIIFCATLVLPCAIIVAGIVAIFWR